MADLMEPPQPERFAWESETLVIMANELDKWTGATLWEWILGHWGKAAAVPPTQGELELAKASARAATGESKMHSIDIQSRRVVADAVAMCSKESKATVSNAVNSGRQALLHESKAAVSSAVNSGRQALLHACRALDQGKRLEDAIQLASQSSKVGPKGRQPGIETASGFLSHLRELCTNEQLVPVWSEGAEGNMEEDHSMADFLIAINAFKSWAERLSKA
eukprot:gene31204-6352_t